MNDEFYIGWERKAPPRIGRVVCGSVIALLIFAIAVALALAGSQRTIGVGAFEWGTQKSLSGIFQARPYPHLLVPRPGASSGQSAFSSYYLVAPLKFGLSPESVASFDGKWVKLKGTLIYRESQVMVETRPDWIQIDAVQTPASLPQPVPLGRQTLVGEIVDSKCFLGVMNPGELAPHRACAIRCISGGIPPVLVVRPEAGQPVYLLLVSADGQPVNQQVLDFVAEPVEISRGGRKAG